VVGGGGGGGVGGGGGGGVWGGGGGWGGVSSHFVVGRRRGRKKKREVIASNTLCGGKREKTVKKGGATHSSYTPYHDEEKVGKGGQSISYNFIIPPMYEEVLSKERDALFISVSYRRRGGRWNAHSCSSSCVTSARERNGVEKKKEKGMSVCSYSLSKTQGKKGGDWPWRFNLEEIGGKIKLTERGRPSLPPPPPPYRGGNKASSQQIPGTIEGKR